MGKADRLDAGRRARRHLTGGTLVNYVITGYVYKVLVEVVFLPVTYPVIALVKRHEPDYVPGAAVMTGAARPA